MLHQFRFSLKFDDQKVLICFVEYALTLASGLFSLVMKELYGSLGDGRHNLSGLSKSFYPDAVIFYAELRF